jgi:hypothetical protein
MALPSMTLSELRDASKQRADMVNGSFISDAEWNSYINSSYFELYDLLVQKFGDDYFVSIDTSITTNGSSERFSLASISPGVYKLLGVDLQLSGTVGASNGQYIPLKPFNMSERAMLGTVSSPYGRLSEIRYRFSGSTLWLNPLPAAGYPVRLWYVPQLTPLTSDTSSADGVSGWLEYVVTDAAIKALQKEESDVSVLMAQKQALAQRIESAAENRDAGAPATVADVGARLSGDLEWM